MDEKVYVAREQPKECIHSIGEPVEMHKPLKVFIEVDGNSFYLCTDCYDNNPELAQHVVKFIH